MRGPARAEGEVTMPKPEQPSGVSDEARELHRIIGASVRDMLSACRIKAQGGADPRLPEGLGDGLQGRRRRGPAPP